MSRLMCLRTLGLSLLVAAATTASAQVPALSSRPGAAYTVYLDFGGFNFSGQWVNTGKSPGNTAAYGNATQIKDIWARTAEKYAAFDINVTTVDPAVAAGKAGSYAIRQKYYDDTAKVMHTVVGNGTWFGVAGGVSYVGVTQDSWAGVTGANGVHTNWVFPNYLASTNKYIAEASAHENGHGLSLNHQSDYKVVGSTVNEYSSNNGSTGNGSDAPIMGDSYSSQRGTWRVGTLNDGTIQNDVATLLSNSGMSLVDDSIGHTFGTATELPFTGTLINSTLAQGYIAPLTNGAPNPIGINNYTKDYFKFIIGQAGSMTLKVSDGGDWITPGTVAAGATLRSKLNIYKAGNLATAFGAGTLAADTLSETFTGVLTPGTYYAEITSFGGLTSSFDSKAKYYDMGSYVLSGFGSFVSFASAPEPGAFVLLGFGLIGMVRLRRRK